MQEEEGRALRLKASTYFMGLIVGLNGKSVVGLLFGTSTDLLASSAELQEVNERAIISTPLRKTKHTLIQEREAVIKRCNTRIASTSSRRTSRWIVSTA